MFRFDFGAPKDGAATGEIDGSQKLDRGDDESGGERCLATEVLIEQKPVGKGEIAHHLISLCKDEVTMRKVEAMAPKSLTPSGMDLVAGVYEGGYKLWECAVDLAEYLYFHHSNDGTFDEHTNVLELGAGHGIPGIMAVKCGARQLVMHDFNEEVIRDVTSVNVHWNVEDSINVRYFSGGWNHLGPLLKKGAQFDVILSAETVYGVTQIQDLSLCIVTLLKPGGVAWISGKSYYFGVGGGIGAFVKQISQLSHDKGVGMNVRRVVELRDGASNVREIVEVRRDADQV